MVIFLRGTNGAGKSTIVKRILRESEMTPVMIPNRRKPLLYRGIFQSSDLSVLGHYEITNGGIDTLGGVGTAIALSVQEAALERHVLLEGKNLQDRTIVRELCDRFSVNDVVFVHVAHDVDDCVKSVRRRGHSIKAETIYAIAERIERTSEELQGRQNYRLGREDAYQKVVALLRP